MELITTLKKTTYYVLPLIGLNLYWFSLIVSMYFFFCFLCFVDVLLWFSIAWSYGVVSSSVWTKWLLNKVIWIVLLAGIIAFLANMSYVVDDDSVTQWLSIVIMWIIIIRLWFETISILENAAIMWDSREDKFFSWIVSIITWFVWIWKKAIDNKLKRYTEWLDRDWES